MIKEDEDQKEVQRLRERLESSLSKAPKWIAGASVQAVRGWKNNHAAAKKIAAKKTATAAELLAAIQSVA